jgi:hypothetical protein
MNVSTQEQMRFIRQQQIVKEVKSFKHITKKSIKLLNFLCLFYGLEADTLTGIEKAVILVLWLLDVKVS